MSLSDHVEGDDYGLPAPYPGENPMARMLRSQAVREYQETHPNPATRTKGFTYDLPDARPLRWPALLFLMALAMLIVRWVYPVADPGTSTYAVAYNLGYMTFTGTGIALGMNSYQHAKSKSMVFGEPITKHFRF